MDMRRALGFSEGGHKGAVKGQKSGCDGEVSEVGHREGVRGARGCNEEGSEAGHEEGIGMQRGWA